MEQQTLPTDSADDASQEAAEIWRNEIQQRVAGYRTRRGRRIEGAFSMRFPFPPAEASATDVRPIAVPEAHAFDSPGSAGQFPNCELAEPAPVSTSDAEPVGGNSSSHHAEDAHSETFAAPAFAVQPRAPLPPRPRAKRKVLAFPRPAIADPGYRLAEPITPEQPRIFEVPEELEVFPATPLLDGLQFARDEHQQPAVSRDHVELSLQPVEISRRLYAGLIDCALVAAATAVLGAVVYKMAPQLTLSKPLLLTAAAVPVLLWAAYQYVFLMYSGRTPGMQMLHLRISTFKSANAAWRQRRSRVIGLYFATASLLMGILWALVDVDALCWHDRISRTYLVAEPTVQ